MGVIRTVLDVVMLEELRMVLKVGDQRRQGIEMAIEQKDMFNGMIVRCRVFRVTNGIFHLDEHFSHFLSAGHRRNDRQHDHGRACQMPCLRMNATRRDFADMGAKLLHPFEQAF